MGENSTGAINLMEQLALFNQYGLIGLVIGALFFSLWILLREIKSIHLLQTDERKSWVNALNANTEVLRQLTGQCVKKSLP